jgi:hypothetical protein
VSEGHPSQLGYLLITSEHVTAHNLEGEQLWENSRGTKPLCLPELLPEFAIAYLPELQAGNTIVCDGPILKARKLAPFKVSLKEASESGYIFEVGPGSIGMWFFMDTITFGIDETLTRMTHYYGMLPAPDSKETNLAYRQHTGPTGADYEIVRIPRNFFEPEERQ